MLLLLLLLLLLLVAIADICRFFLRGFPPHPAAPLLALLYFCPK